MLCIKSLNVKELCLKIIVSSFFTLDLPTGRGPGGGSFSPVRVDLIKLLTIIIGRQKRKMRHLKFRTGRYNNIFYICDYLFGLSLQAVFNLGPVS